MGSVSIKQGGWVGLLRKEQEEGRELAVQVSGKMHTCTENTWHKGPGMGNRLCTFSLGLKALNHFPRKLNCHDPTSSSVQDLKEI